MEAIFKLRRFLDAAPPPAKAKVEVCEFCGVGLAGEHGHVIDVELPFLPGHLGMKHHLQKKIAQFVSQRRGVGQLDSGGDLISFLDGIRRYRRKILFQIPGATGFRITQPPHDLEQARDVSGGGRTVVAHA